jgi:hypothetical protein
LPFERLTALPSPAAGAWGCRRHTATNHQTAQREVSATAICVSTVVAMTIAVTAVTRPKAKA